MSTQHYQQLVFKIKVLTVIFCLTCLSSQAKQPVIATYYVASGNPIAVSNLPAKKLTHILYAFGALCGNNSTANDEIQKAIAIACKGKPPYSAVFFHEKEVMSELSAFKKLKLQHPHLRILPSFGGWTLSQPFHGMAKSGVDRKHFVQSAIELIEKNDVFDGIDIDWEYPGGGGKSQITLTKSQAINERNAFKLLMKEFRVKLDKLAINTGRKYQLTAAVSGSKARTQAIDWKGTIPAMDYVFAMTYDFSVGNGQAGHHTNLFSSNISSLSTEGMINNLIDAGVPAKKIAVGVAFYGRGWTNVDWQDKLFSKNNKAISTGSYSYKHLKKNPPSGYIYGYDPQVQAAYFFNAKVKGFISFR